VICDGLVVCVLSEFRCGTDAERTGQHWVSRGQRNRDQVQTSSASTPTLTCRDEPFTVLKSGLDKSVCTSYFIPLNPYEICAHYKLQIYGSNHARHF